MNERMPHPDGDKGHRESLEQKEHELARMRAKIEDVAEEVRLVKELLIVNGAADAHDIKATKEALQKGNEALREIIRHMRELAETLKD